MTCEPIIKDGRVTGYMCFPSFYRYTHNGREYLFEYSYTNGPWPLRKKDFEPWRRVPQAFWEMWDHFSKLPKDEQRRYHI